MGTIAPIQGTFPRNPSQAAALLGLAIDVKRDFGASGSSQTTTGSIESGSNVLALAEPLDFQNGQGISVAGAGASGGLLVTTIVSGAAYYDAGTTALTLQTTAETSVSGATVLHDDTAAIQAAIKALGENGGTITFPDGVYYVNNASTAETANDYNTLLLN